MSDVFVDFFVAKRKSFDNVSATIEAHRLVDAHKEMQRICPSAEAYMQELQGVMRKNPTQEFCEHEQFVVNMTRLAGLVCVKLGNACGYEYVQGNKREDVLAEAAAHYFDLAIDLGVEGRKQRVNELMILDDMSDVLIPAFFGMGNYYIWAGAEENCRIAFEQCVSLNPFDDEPAQEAKKMAGEYLERMKQGKTPVQVTENEASHLVEMLLAKGAAEQDFGVSPIESYEQAYQLARQKKLQPGLTMASIRLGTAYYRYRNQQEGFQLIEDGLQMARRLQYEDLEGDALFSRGMIYAAKDDVENAEQDFRSALKLAQKVQNRRQEAKLWLELGKLTANQKESPREAIGYLNNALQLAKREEDNSLEFYTYKFILMASQEIGLAENAIQAGEQALKLAPEINAGEEKRLLFGMGMAYRDMGSFEKAQQCWAESIRLNDESDEPELAGLVASRSGFTFLESGNENATIRQFERVVAFYEKAGNTNMAQSHRMLIKDLRKQHYSDTEIDIAYEEMQHCEKHGNYRRKVQILKRLLQIIPPKEKIWSLSQFQLGHTYFWENPSGNRSESIELAIQAFQAALSARPPSDTLAEIYRNIGSAYYVRPQGARAENIEQTIKYLEEALKHTGIDLELRTDILSDLGVTYAERLKGDRAENFEKALVICTEAMRITPKSKAPEKWAPAASGLASIYFERLQGDRAENLEQAIKLAEEALECLTPEKESQRKHWITAASYLAHSLLMRVNGVKKDNVKRAKEICDMVLPWVNIRVFPDMWMKFQDLLAHTYAYLPEMERKVAFEKAIQVLENAIKEISPNEYPFAWSLSAVNLAEIYADRIEGNRSENLLRSVDLAMQAGAISEKDKDDLGLGLSFMIQAKSLGWLTGPTYKNNQEEALKLFEKALTILKREIEPRRWGLAKMNQAVVYTFRISGDRAENIERAINIYREVEESNTLNYEQYPFDWASLMQNIAVAYRNRILGNSDENFAVVIEKNEMALEVFTPEAFPSSYATIISNLGVAYYKRSQASEEDIERAIRCFDQARKIVTYEKDPTEWRKSMGNLGHIYMDRLKGNQYENLNSAISILEEALSKTDPHTQEGLNMLHNLGLAYALQGPRLPGALQKAQSCYDQIVSRIDLDGFPERYRRVYHDIGNLYAQQAPQAPALWIKAADAYVESMRASAKIYLDSATDTARIAQLQEFRSIPAKAAYALARAGKLQEAVLTLEQNKARALREHLALDKSLLENLPPTIQNELNRLGARITNLEIEFRNMEAGGPGVRDFLSVSEELRAVRIERNKALEFIRKQIPEFMPTEPDFAAITRVAAQLAVPLVYLVPSMQGSLALIVTPKGNIQTVWVDEFTWASLSNVLLQRGADGVAYLYAMVQKPRALPALLKDIVLPVVQSLMRPVAQAIHDLGFRNAVLLPMDNLSLLPLHVALLEQISFCYLPSAMTFRTIAANFSKRAKTQPFFLGVGNPASFDLPSLEFAKWEVTETARLFGRQNSQVALESAATLNRLAEFSHAATHLHFSCHGNYDVATPLNSGLYLSGKDCLLLRDVLNGRLNLKNIQLVILSACQTGVPDFRRVPDEAVGFPAGFIQAGAARVISSLWPVDDLSTALLFERFYAFLFSENLHPAVALQKAQVWLKNLHTDELMRYLEKKQAQPDTDKAFIARLRHTVKSRGTGKIFESPYYWAAFYYTGI